MNPLLTTEEIAEKLHVSKRTIERLLEKDQIPHLRFGRSVRFDLSEVIRDGKERAHDQQR